MQQGYTARPNIDTLLDTLGSQLQGPFDSIGRASAAGQTPAASPPSAAYRAAAAVSPHSTGSTVFESVASRAPPESLRASRDVPRAAAGGPPTENLGRLSVASIAGGLPNAPLARPSTSRPLSVGALQFSLIQQIHATSSASPQMITDDPSKGPDNDPAWECSRPYACMHLQPRQDALNRPYLATVS